jgi:hypothetical protein
VRFNRVSFPTPALCRKVLDGEGAKIAYFSSIDLRHFRVDGNAGRPWSNI